jgi:hypothetical protein
MVFLMRLPYYILQQIKKMKIKISLLFTLCFLSVISFSQEESDVFFKHNLMVKNVESENRYASRNLYNSLRKRLAKKFIIHPQSYFFLESHVEVGESKKIEAMESYTYTDLTITFQFGNTVNNNYKQWVYEGKGKGSNENDAVNKGVSAFFKSPDGLKVLKAELDAYIQSELGENCMAFIEKAGAALNENEPKKAALILSVINEKSDCYARKEALEKQIIDQHKVNYCENEMQKIQVMVNSGQYRQLNSAVYKLLLIPPDAPCAQQALDLSNQIGEKMTRKEGKVYDLLIKYQGMHSNYSYRDWRRIYYEEILK